MNAPVALRKDQSAIPALAMNEGELMNVLRNSLYPGAQDESIKLAVGYCKAAGLDIMQKPVHLVPMWDSKARQMRDVVMPGIGLYRTQAARSGAYAGVTEPEFGPDTTEILGGVEITYPLWCRVTVKRRLDDGTVAEFTAREFWKENYAVKGGQEKSIAPNAMWTKRPYGQIAKVAEAQALRKAFPEIGAQPTAEEYEGRPLDMGTIDRETGEVTPAARPELQPYDDAAIDANLEAWKGVVASGRKTIDGLIATIKTKATLSAEQEQRIRTGLTEQAPVVDAEFTAEYEGAEQ